MQSAVFPPAKADDGGGGGGDAYGPTTKRRRVDDEATHAAGGDATASLTGGGGGGGDVVAWNQLQHRQQRVLLQQQQHHHHQHRQQPYQPQQPQHYPQQLLQKPQHQPPLPPAPIRHPQYSSAYDSSSVPAVEYAGGAGPAALRHAATGSPVLSSPPHPNPRHEGVVPFDDSAHGGTSGAQWNPAAGPPSYPDVTSYPQPYFHHHGDPSMYTSSWPSDTTATAPTVTAAAAATDADRSVSYGAPAAESYASLIPPQSAAAAAAAAADPMALIPATSSVVQRAEQAVGAFGAGASGAAFQPFSDVGVDAGLPYTYAVANPRAVDPFRSEGALYFDSGSLTHKVQSLHILDDLATRVIGTISKASFLEVQDLMRGDDTEESQAYITLKSLFDQTRKVYSRDSPFIDAVAIQMFQPKQQEIIRKANIATFISSILGAHDLNFFQLNEYFMETFVPPGHRLLKWQGAIFLELKTQAYISALLNSTGSSPEAMLDELFPPHLDEQILTRHPDAPSLSPSEQDFLDRSRLRRKYLLEVPSRDEAQKKYQWNEFVRDFASSINKNVDAILNVPARAHPIFGDAHLDSTTAAAQGMRDPLAERNAHPTLSALNTAPAAGLSNISQPSSGGGGNRKTIITVSTTRQPWTKPEEDALLAGLEKVNGPHWSQILALYGRGGSVSEVLKGRNQVQLKDKARNMKLWYLKLGKDVPAALQGVTGELRKRGGARARAALGLLDDEDGERGRGTAESAEDGDSAPGDQSGSNKKKTEKKTERNPRM